MTSANYSHQLKERHLHLKRRSSNQGLVSLPQRERKRMDAEEIRRIYLGLKNPHPEIQSLESSITHESSYLQMVKTEHQSDCKPYDSLSSYNNFLQNKGIQGQKLELNRQKAQQKIGEKLLLAFEVILCDTNTETVEKQNVFRLIDQLSVRIQTGCFDLLSQNKAITKRYVERLTSFLKLLADPENTYLRTGIINQSIEAESIFSLDQSELIDPERRKRQKLIADSFLNQLIVVKKDEEGDESGRMITELPETPMLRFAKRSSLATQTSVRNSVFEEVKRMVKKRGTKLHQIYQEELPPDISFLLQSNLNTLFI